MSTLAERFQDIKERKFSSPMIRMFANYIRRGGVKSVKDIYPSTYTQWREWANELIESKNKKLPKSEKLPIIKPKARSLTWMQAVILLAIATLRKSTHEKPIHRDELDLQDIEALAFSLDFQFKLIELLESTFKDLVPGYEIPRIFTALTGKCFEDCSLNGTLYRLFKNAGQCLRVDDYYTQAQIRHVLSVYEKNCARHLENKAKAAQKRKAS